MTEFEERPVPRAYKTLYMGRDLGDTMPMWRVQTESPEERKGFPYGVVSPSALEDSPDGEFISSGENTKGRQTQRLGVFVDLKRTDALNHWARSKERAILCSNPANEPTRQTACCGGTRTNPSRLRTNGAIGSMAAATDCCDARMCLQPEARACP